MAFQYDSVSYSSLVLRSINVMVLPPRSALTSSPACWFVPPPCTPSRAASMDPAAPAAVHGFTLNGFADDDEAFLSDALSGLSQKLCIQCALPPGAICLNVAMRPGSNAAIARRVKSRQTRPPPAFSNSIPNSTVGS